MSTPSDAQRGAAVALELKHLLEQLESGRRDVAAMRAWLQDHASDLNSIGASLDASYDLLDRAAHAGHPDVMLALLEAGARPEPYIDLNSDLLCTTNIFDLNGDELHDAGIAARLRRMHDVYVLRMLLYEFIPYGTQTCVSHDRLECLRVMVEVDPRSRGYTEDFDESLLHMAALHCKPRIVDYLMQSGWSLTSHDLNRYGLSPLGSCLFASPGAYLEDMFAILLQFLCHTEDAAGVVRASGLCDVDDFTPPDASLDLESYMPSPQRVRMHIYVCAAINAVSSLPRYVLNASDPHVLLTRSPSILHSLPLDEHVTTAEGVVYLRDPLRLGGITVLPLAAVEHGHVVQVTEAVPVHALRFAVTVDALCTVNEAVCADKKQYKDQKCVDVLRDSGVPIVTSSSPTLRHWAWMRRSHALCARRREVLHARVGPGARRPGSADLASQSGPRCL